VNFAENGEFLSSVLCPVFNSTTLFVTRFCQERKCKNRFSCISSSKVDRFTSNQDKMISDPLDADRPIRLHQQKCFIFSRPPY